MPVFRAGRPYDPGLDVRDLDGLAAILQREMPHGAFWPLVAIRRAGKTWALKALEHRLAPQAMVLDLRRDGQAFDGDITTRHLLIDEPGERLGAGAEFIERCVDLRSKGVRILVAMTLAEFHALEEADGATRRLERKDLHFLRPLTEGESDRMRKRARWASSLSLPPEWLRNPFLLELALEQAEADRDLREDIPGLLRAAISLAGDARHFYVQAVFQMGLNDAQRHAIREAAHTGAGSGEPSKMLAKIGLLDQGSPERYRLVDPVLADYLPPPLIIHHVSDIHVGERSAERVDVKVRGALGALLGGGVGAGPVRAAYIEHLQSQKAGGRAPHLVVISGDLAERGDKTLYDQLSDWLAALKANLADHPHLTGELPRVLLVGGNHDVDWGQVMEADGGRARHRPFAESFEAYPHPHLEIAPERRDLARVEYRELGVAFLLLGSSEFGGEVEDDPDRRKLVDMIEELRKELVRSSDADEASKILDRVSRIDPGLVHQADLRRVSDHAWDLPVRIAVLHHPLSPMPPTEVAHFAGLINAGQLKSVLFSKQFCLALHGHMHTGWFAKEQWMGPRGEWKTLHIAAAPTLGSRETTDPHGYNEVTILREGEQYVVKVRRIVRGGEAWTVQAEMSFLPREQDQGPIRRL